MKPSAWKDQIANGRVFELRSQSKRFDPPCALVIDEDAKWGGRLVTCVDKHGVVGRGLYRRQSNPHIDVERMRREDFTSRKIARRRPDLERFDADDIALIYYGIPVDFGGRLHPMYVHGTGHIPSVVPATWTVFWTLDDRYWHMPDSDKETLRGLLWGAWHFEQYGGSASCGFQFSHAWFTRHVDPKRLRQIENLLRERLRHLVRQEVRVVQWHEPKTQHTHTFELRRDCPALSMRWCRIQHANGEGISVGSL